MTSNFPIYYNSLILFITDNLKCWIPLVQPVKAKNSISTFSIFYLPIFCWYRGLNSMFYTCRCSTRALYDLVIFVIGSSFTRLTCTAILLLMLPLYLREQMCATTPNVFDWDGGLAKFLPGLASKYDPPDLHLTSS
jgi:hypothetical protein